MTMFHTYQKCVPFFALSHGLIGGIIGWKITSEDDPIGNHRVFYSLIGTSIGMSSGIVFPLTYTLVYSKLLLSLLLIKRLNFTKKK